MACPELSSSGTGAPTAIFAETDHIPVSASRLPTVQLDGISDIQRVNALAEGPIRFGSAGLTIVYGDNGSGKTGVARILKKSCRARDPEGKILSNVFGRSETEPAKATIHYRADEESKTHDWVDGEPGDSNLSTINVFDTKCAAVQIEQPNVISYTPHIVTVFSDLATATWRVHTELEGRKTRIEAGLA